MFMRLHIVFCKVKTEWMNVFLFLRHICKAYLYCGCVRRGYPSPIALCFKQKECNIQFINNILKSKLFLLLSVKDSIESIVKGSSVKGCVLGQGTEWNTSIFPLQGRALSSCGGGVRSKRL